MRVYELWRSADVTGISGTGIVAQVVTFDSGKTVVAWNVKDRPNSVAVYDSLDQVIQIHTHGGLSYLLEVWHSENESSSSCEV